MHQSFGNTIQEQIERVENIYPQFRIHSAQSLDAGQNNDVVLFNDAWIFRFPHHELGAINLENEVITLRYLKERLPLQIPFPQYVNLKPENISQSFMGYQMIAGTALTRERAKSINTNDLSIIASQLDAFLHALHTLSVPHKVASVIRVTNTADYWSEMFERIQRLLFPHMRHEARDQVTHHFNSFLQEASNCGVALIHGDFGAKNILVDEGCKRVVGVIDFGSVAMGDPAVDYAAVATIHPRMLELMAQSNPSVLQYISRIEFYKGTFALQEALYGAESGDENAFRSGLMQYV